MVEVRIRKGRKGDKGQLIGLLSELARFERLEPPSIAGRKRLLDDLFERKRIGVFVASEGKRLVGYALYYYTYSSFLAKPTLYLEDLYVLDEVRGGGVGFALFRRCVEEAMKEGCGRMEWSVLTWNQKALDFYERLGARRMSDWYVYRLDEEALRRVPKAVQWWRP